MRPGMEQMLSLASFSAWPYGEKGIGGKTQVSEVNYLNKPGRF